MVSRMAGKRTWSNRRPEAGELAILVLAAAVMATIVGVVLLWVLHWMAGGAILVVAGIVAILFSWRRVF